MINKISINTKMGWVSVFAEDNKITQIKFGNNYLIGAQYWASEEIISIVYCSYIFYAGYIVLMPSIYLLNKQNWTPIFIGTGAIINVFLNIILIKYYNTIVL